MHKEFEKDVEFFDSDLCKSRNNCVICRRDAKFRNRMEKHFKGPWECPLAIPIDAKDDQFPKPIWDIYLDNLKKREEQEKKIQEITNALDELVMSLSGENLKRVELIKNFFFPTSNNKALTCINSQKQIGEVDQVCCGGTVKRVPAYDCKIHIICTDKKCSNCKSYKAKDGQK